MKNNFNNKKFTCKKNISKNAFKKCNIITSLSEVECFLNNLDLIFSNIKLINIFKKFK